MDKRESNNAKILFADGSSFTGEFENDQIRGNGEYIDKYLNRHENEKGRGYFENCCLNGYGFFFILIGLEE